MVAAVVAVLLVVAGGAPVTHAQDAYPMDARRHPGGSSREELDEFIEAQTEHVNPALQAGRECRGARRGERPSSETCTSGCSCRRWRTSPISTAAARWRSRSIGGTGSSLDERVRRTISGHRSYALRYRPELSVETAITRADSRWPGSRRSKWRRGASPTGRRSCSSVFRSSAATTWSSAYTSATWDPGRPSGSSSRTTRASRSSTAPPSCSAPSASGRATSRPAWPEWSSRWSAPSCGTTRS